MELLPLIAALTSFGAVAFLILGLWGPRVDVVQQLQAPHRYAGPTEPPKPPVLREKRISRFTTIDQLLSRSAIIARIATELDQADLPLRVEEYFGIRILSGLLLALLVFPQNSFAAVAIGFIGFLLPGWYVGWRRRQRLRQIDGQLPELLTIVSNSLKSGYGLMQALDFAANQMAPPIAKELRRTLLEANLGAGIDAALEGLRERIPSYDLDMVITAITIQRAVGGNLAEILDNVGHIMRERARIRGEVRTLTAQQRLSGVIIGALPIVVAFGLWALNPEYIEPLLSSPIGWIALAGAGLLQLLGILAIRRILAIEV